MWARALNPSRVTSRRLAAAYIARRRLHFTPVPFAVKPFFLADIGEGIRECEVIQWFVQPGARVEQFDKLCEVQSDKASVEITSRFDGVIKKLYYDAGDMAIVGKPLVDIDIDGEVAEEPAPIKLEDTTPAEGFKSQIPTPSPASTTAPNIPPEHKHSKLATPAVRRICKELGVEITHVQGTGKDGRVMKEDVAAFAECLKSGQTAAELPQAPVQPPSTAIASETTAPLTPMQMQMFKTMTKSLSIPHFLFSDDVHLDPLTTCRSRINAELASGNVSQSAQKISYMPFLIKAMSLALQKYPILNARLNTDGDKPSLVMRPQHNIGVAMDTPAGLIVPNIKNVQNLSILEIGEELLRLQRAGAVGQLLPPDLKGGTITISNIGNIGGRVVSPVIVNSEVAILGIGKAKTSPAFDCHGAVVPKTEMVFSWSADHRVIDGATMARMATLMKEFVEKPELMLARIR
ncbi:2-oxoacid dehydrogenases acyltransferase-domain-containing protein [Tirmania nivea]|nr:2-oxoacid dehydrogenases acyltransferase-domain-containing protein [Tirmania nivea]